MLQYLKKKNDKSVRSSGTISEFSKLDDFHNIYRIMQSDMTELNDLCNEPIHVNFMTIFAENVLSAC